MMCQNCHHNEAENHFVINYMGTEREVHLCDACTRQAQQYMQNVYKHYGPGTMLPGMDQVQEQGVRALGRGPFPVDLGEEIKKRRKLSALKSQLKEAVQREKYEKAAVLRDQIQSMEKEVYAHGL